MALFNGIEFGGGDVVESESERWEDARRSAGGSIASSMGETMVGGCGTTASFAWVPSMADEMQRSDTLKACVCGLVMYNGGRMMYEGQRSAQPGCKNRAGTRC